MSIWFSPEDPKGADDAATIAERDERATGRAATSTVFGVARNSRRRVFLPAWLPIACWPALVVLALCGGFVGGAAAVSCAIGAVALGVGLVWGASGIPEPSGSDAAQRGPSDSP